jgi:hypothetical protein
MTIPNELLGKWEVLRSAGDMTEIAERADVSTVTISKAFSTAKCSDEVFKVIAEFYQDKEEMISSYLTDYSNE